MVILHITATPGDGLQHYALRVDDGPEIDMPANAGTAEVAGTCGDKSPHTLYYHLFGTAGATVGVRIVCEDGALKLDIPLEIFPPGPNMNGDVEFVL